MRGRSSSLTIVVGSSFIAMSGLLAQTVPQAAAPAVSIAVALATRGPNRDVSVAGRAVVATGKLQSRAFDIAIDDGTSGLRLFSRSSLIQVREGDSVQATGVIKTYRGNIELVASTVAVIPASNVIVVPREVPIDLATMARHAKADSGCGSRMKPRRARARSRCGCPRTMARRSISPQCSSPTASS
jgi:hypothetical protein